MHTVTPLPQKRLQMRIRALFECLTSMGWMGVRESQPSSVSMLRRERLSTITISCPWSLRYSDVGHPQNPSPPRTITFFGAAAPFAPLTAWFIATLLVRCSEVGAVGIVKQETKHGSKEAIKTSFMVYCERVKGSTQLRRTLSNAAIEGKAGNNDQW